MSNQIPFGGFDASEFAENPEPRVACVLVLDVSGSMAGRAIAELNAGLVEFADTMAADSLASRRAEVAVVTFGGSVVVQTPFTSAEVFIPPLLTTSGQTPMGAAIGKAIDLVADRKATYKRAGISYYRPWIFLITDGAPTDAWQAAADRVHQGEREKAFVFFAVGVEDAEMATLRAIAVRDPLKLRGLSFRELFVWLSQSMQSISQSAPSDRLALPAPSGWAEI